MRDVALDPLQLPADFWSRPGTTSALAARDVGALYRLILDETRVSQTRLGTAVDMAQGRVSAIMSGKQNVKHASVLTRIADGLSMPVHARRTLGLAPGVVPGTEYPLTTERAVASLGELWRSDEAKALELLSAPADAGVWNSAALAWLVSDPDILCRAVRLDELWGRATSAASATLLHCSPSSTTASAERTRAAR